MTIFLKSLLVSSVLISASVSVFGGEEKSELVGSYDSQSAYRLHQNWNLKKFLRVSPEGGYSYSNLAQQLPHATISRQGPVVELVRELDPALEQFSVLWESESHELQELILANSSPVRSMMVVRDGKVIYEKYPKIKSHENHVWMSNSKPVASYLLSQLEREGLFDEQKTVGYYLPQARGTSWESIKVVDVLHMQTGLDLIEGAEQRENADSSFSRFMVSELGYPNPEGVVQTHNEALLDIGHLREPGKAFEYSSANTQMLGVLIEAITGERLVDTISSRLWRHIGAQGDAQLALSPQGNGIIHGLISSRLEDMAKFAMLYTPSAGLLSSRTLVSADTLKKIQTAGRPENYLNGSVGRKLQRRFSELPLANAYQWDAVFTDGDIYKGGMNGQGIYISPSKNLVVVWFANGYTQVPMEKVARSIALSQ